ncbi:MAG TPA: type II CAAX endopeptidase family protein [Phycisphaerales bacterium]|nr:type II CAAX endopeptidase family protein [Phycisphaerales bacterium]HMP38475.1 type II CAAX endopeptidase family protein [Phycisphaerales bacterium]
MTTPDPRNPEPEPERHVAPPSAPSAGPRSGQGEAAAATERRSGVGAAADSARLGGSAGSPPEGSQVDVDSPHRSGPLASRRLDRPFAAIAILVLLLAAAGVFLIQREIRSAEPTEGGIGPEIRVMELVSRYLVGTRSIMGEKPGAESASGDDPLAGAIDQIRGGDLAQRLRAVAVEADLLGAEAGLRSLDELRRLLARSELPGERRAEAATTIERMERILELRRIEGPIPDDADARALSAELGWFGELLVHPAYAASPRRAELDAAARRLVFALVIALGGVALLAIVGVAGCILVVTLSLLGRWRWHFSARPDRSGLWIETAVLWLVLLISSMQILGALVPAALELPATIACFGISAAALLWPRLRGMPWDRIRRELGLHRGEGVAFEAACGIATYAMTLPLLAVGLVGTFLLSRPGAPGAPGAPGHAEDELVREVVPSHPILELIADGSGTARLQAVVLACLAAPIIEELLFRGALYRGVRGATRTMGRCLSAVVSAIAVGAIFAAIHPPGIVAIPALTAIAAGFALGREWRDSLIAPMVAHALHNGLLVGVMLVAFA